MSVKILPEYSEQLETYFKEFNIKWFDYSEFSNLKTVGVGGYAVVYSANFQGQTYALKSLNINLSFDDKAFKQFKRELNCLYTVENHPNIVKFYGICRDDRMGNFMLVLQYATEGNLRKHLQNKQKDGVYKILWVDLIRIAKEIALGLSYLHDINIVHRDLHSMNILINNGRAMITDFGISKQLDTATTGATSSTGAKGMPAYLEPQCYIHCFPYEEKVFKLNEKSDIYSLGVLFWELTSGIPPFNNIRDNTAIIFQIAYGVREKIIENTPLGFSNLFRKCWSTEPDHRPSLIEILAELDKLSAENVEFISNNINSGSNSASSTDICPVELIEKIISEEIKVLDYNQFRVLRKIGEGGFGIVYEAEWEDRGLMVALKSFNERLHESIENILKAFIEEVF